jgi:putative SOS response-associated peptidase YedK
MCGRFTITITIGYAERFSVGCGVVPDTPRYNVAPGQQIPVIVRTNEGNEAIPMEWGLVPSWARETPVARPFINARAESLLSKPAFRGPVRYRRCLVPATGFYEWARTGKSRTPFYFRRKDNALFAFAGLYERWSPGPGDGRAGFAIVTTAPNELIRGIHDRMPAILTKGDEEEWLAPGVPTDEDCRRLLAPYPASAMESYRVSPAVNNPSAEGELLVKPADTGLWF